MKKILSLISALILSTTASTSIVSCSFFDFEKNNASPKTINPTEEENQNIYLRSLKILLDKMNSSNTSDIKNFDYYFEDIDLTVNLKYKSLTHDKIVSGEILNPESQYPTAEALFYEIYTVSFEQSNIIYSRDIIAIDRYNFLKAEIIKESFLGTLATFITRANDPEYPVEIPKIKYEDFSDDFLQDLIKKSNFWSQDCSLSFESLNSDEIKIKLTPTPAELITEIDGEKYYSYALSFLDQEEFSISKEEIKSFLI